MQEEDWRPMKRWWKNNQWSQCIRLSNGGTKDTNLFAPVQIAWLGHQKTMEGFLWVMISSRSRCLGEPPALVKTAWLCSRSRKLTRSIWSQWSRKPRCYMRSKVCWHGTTPCWIQRKGRSCLKTLSRSVIAGGVCQKKFSTSTECSDKRKRILITKPLPKTKPQTI